MVEIFDSYMRKRLIDVALRRRRTKTISMGTLSFEAVAPLGNGKYTVRSQSTASLQYSVDIEAGFCECNVGQSGSLCKHQAACAEYSMTALPQVFTATSENRRWLASVAVGEENTPPETFFRGLLEPSPAREGVRIVSGVPEEDAIEEMEPHSTKEIEKQQCDVDISEFVAALQAAVEKHGNEHTVTAFTTAVKTVKKVKNSNMLNSMIHSLGSGICATGAGRGKIRCQPASIARRAPGKPKGAAPLGKGRKPKSLPENAKPKRPRNLGKNIANNLANAKSHGSGH